MLFWVERFPCEKNGYRTSVAPIGLRGLWSLHEIKWGQEGNNEYFKTNKLLCL